MRIFFAEGGLRRKRFFVTNGLSNIRLTLNGKDKNSASEVFNVSLKYSILN